MKNIKKWMLLPCLLLLIVTLSGCAKKAPQPKEGYHRLKASDDSYSIEIPENLEYRINSEDNSKFTLDLYSVKDEMYLYGSSVKKTREVDLLDVAMNDKVSYLGDKENIRDDSGMNEITISGYKACYYTLTYYDKEYQKDFYTNVVWIETDSKLYLLNFEVISENKDSYVPVFEHMMNSFCELK